MHMTSPASLTKKEAHMTTRLPVVWNFPKLQPNSWMAGPYLEWWEGRMHMIEGIEGVTLKWIHPSHHQLGLWWQWQHMHNVPYSRGIYLPFLPGHKHHPKDKVRIFTATLFFFWCCTIAALELKIRFPPFSTSYFCTVPLFSEIGMGGVPNSHP